MARQMKSTDKRKTFSLVSCPDDLINFDVSYTIVNMKSYIQNEKKF